MKKKILIIEDEDDFQDILNQFLEPAGYDLAFASDGESALRFLARNPIDLIIADVNLPIKDGYATCREIRANPHWRNIPILMLTIRSRDEEIARGLDIGADDYMTKPVDPLELGARIRKLLASGE